MAPNRGTAGYLGQRPNGGVTSTTTAPGAWIPVQVSEKLQDSEFPVWDSGPIVGEILHLSLYNSATLSGQGLLPTTGGTVSRSEYSQLFNVIGTKYGAGDGSTTFGLPNVSSLSWVQYTTTSGNIGTTGNGLLPAHTHLYQGTPGASSPNAAQNPNSQPTPYNPSSSTGAMSSFGNANGNICKSADFVPYIVAKVVTPLIPVGAVFVYLDTRQPPEIPAKYLVASGQYLSRTEYGALYNIMGTTYGSTTSENFALPDLRGAFVCNQQSATLSGVRADEVASHRHDYTRATGTRAGYFTGGGGTCAVGSGDATTSTVGGNETRPPNLSVIYVVRALP